jgi:hypothetical protein
MRSSVNVKLVSLALNAVVFATATRAAAAAPPAAQTQPAAAAAPAAPAQNLEKPASSLQVKQLQPVYTAGESVLGAGLALGGLNGAAGSTTVPPVYLGFDYGVHPDVSVGLVASYYKSSVAIGYGLGDFSYTYYTVGGRGSYHFGKYLPVEKLDLYGGLMLAYGVVSVSTSAPGPTALSAASTNLIVWGAHLGARYFFTQALAAQVELGVGLGNLSVGLAYKM